MQFSAVFVATALAAAGFANGAPEVGWFTTRSCEGTPSEDYRNIACNSCVDPPLDWYAALITGLGSNQRWSGHNEDKCTSKSQVAQGYGNACLTAGHTALRSVYIAC